MLLSNKRIEKPPEDPKPGIAGGSKNSIFAPRFLDFSSNSSIISVTFLSLSSHDFRLIKQVPALEPLPSVMIS